MHAWLESNLQKEKNTSFLTHQGHESDRKENYIDDNDSWRRLESLEVGNGQGNTIALRRSARLS